MNHFKNKHLQSRGDTIVEVLIAIAIVSLILVSAFVTSHQSLAATRDAQEHAEASQVLKAQIELARTVYAIAATDADNQMLTTHALFCIDGSSGTATVQTFTGSAYAAGGAKLLPADTDTFQNYPKPCQSSAGSYNYNIAVENHWTNDTLIPNDDGTLVFHARWDNLRGGHDEVTYTYRSHTATAAVAAGDAVIGEGDCSVTDTCGHPDPTKWYFDVYRPNLSKNPDSIVAGCEWDWGDGTPPEISGSLNGTPINADCYDGGYALHIMHNIPADQNPWSVPPHSTPPPLSWCHDYTLTLTEYFKNGAPPALYQYTLFLPYGPPSDNANCDPSK
jgi:type II secretory pathway pseudopilin PulG